jgi:tetratricopeptide (TPR) repeat protein
MNLFARIISHAFAILIVLLLAVGFIYRGDLFPEFDIPEYLSLEKAESTIVAEEQATEAAPAAKPETVPAGGEPETPTAMPAGEMPAVEQPTPEPSVAEPPEAVQAAGPEAAAETAEEALPEAAPVGIQAEAGVPAAAEAGGIAESRAGLAEPVAESAAEQVEETAGDQGVTATGAAETGAPEGVVAPAPAEPAAAESTGSGVTTPSVEAGQLPEAVVTAIPAIEETAPAPKSSAEAAPEPVPAAPEIATDEDKDTAAMRPYELLAKAREAFWLRDYEAAEKYYLALTRREPDNPDGFGELANMYFSQGNWEEATAAYYETGIRLINEGLLGHAGQMVEVIRGLNGTQADDLEQKIDAARKNPAP